MTETKCSGCGCILIHPDNIRLEIVDCRDGLGHMWWELPVDEVPDIIDIKKLMVEGKVFTY